MKIDSVGTEWIGALIIGIGLVFVGAILSGTIVWAVWPIAIPAAFPGLVSAGIMSAKLTWWQSVCLSWIAGLLIKSSNSNTNKKD